VVEDDERDGLPKSIRTDVNIAAVADLVKNDSLITSRMIAESLNIPRTVVLRILKQDFGKRKLCARFVSHSLTPEQREDADKHFFNKIIWEMKPGVLPMTPKQNDRVLTGLVRHLLGGRN